MIASFAGLAYCMLLSATEPDCAEIHAMAKMANAKTAAILTAWERQDGDSYRAKVAFAFRFFELHPADLRAASAVLELIPQNEEQDFVWHSFGQVLSCGSESEEDMKALGRLQVRLPRDLAEAVWLVPNKMLAYVAYADTSGGYPDSDYAVQMQRVCRSQHREFLKAVDQLSPDAKKWFLSNTFNPNGCHALHYPEQ